MSASVTVELPAEIFQQVQQAASTARLTPEEWILVVLRRQLAVRDPRLRRHFGSVSLGGPSGVDNESIDTDLARVYSNQDS